MRGYWHWAHHPSYYAIANNYELYRYDYIDDGYPLCAGGGSVDVGRRKRDYLVPADGLFKHHTLIPI
jgi:hypothetical protein